MRIFVFCLLILSFQSYAQTTLKLENAISIAQEKSIPSIIAKSNYQLSNYQYEIFKINLKPQINLIGSPIAYSQDFLNVIQPDGTTIFRKREQNYGTFGSSLMHYIPYTNTNVSLGTSLIKFNDYALDRTEYSGIPILLEINQPLFAFNALKWKKKTEPLKLKEAERTFERNKKAIAYETTLLFFQLLMAKEKYVLASKNKENQMLLYNTEQKKIDLGTTNKTKILQLELQLVKSDRELLESQKNIKDANDKLSRYLGLKDGDFNPELPISLKEFDGKDEALLIEKLKDVRPEFVANKIRLLEADAQIEEARKKRFNLSFSGSAGFNSASQNFKNLYSHLTQRKSVQLSINMPIIDWGKTKKDIDFAKLNKENIDLTIQEGERNLIDEMLTIVNNINLIRENIGFAFKTDQIANENYELVLQQTQRGSATITDFNIATQQKDEARLAYISSIQSFWETYNYLQTYIYTLSNED